MLKEGCYTRANEISSNTTSFWYIKKDSTFIHVLRWSKNLQIKSIRMGTWHYLGDSMLSLKYQRLKSSLLLNSKIEYHAETKGSPDSVYFNVSIKGLNCALPGYCGLVFDNEKKEYASFGIAVGYGFGGVIVDANGNATFAIHKNLYFGSIGVNTTSGYYPITVTTFPYNNHHTLVITVPLKDSTNDINFISLDDREVFRYRPIPPGKKIRVSNADLVINFITKDKTPFLNVLYESKKTQPYLTGPIDELIEYLRRE